MEPVPKVWPRQIYFFANPDADSACGSPILPSLKNTYGDNTDPTAERGGDAGVFATAHGRVWELARLVFETRQREQSPDDPPAEFSGEDGQGIGRYR